MDKDEKQRPSLALIICSLFVCGCTSILPHPERYHVTDVDSDVRCFGAMSSSSVLDPRAGMQINSGEQFSFSEKVRMSLPVFGILLSFPSALDAGRGCTHQQWSYETNHDRPGSKQQLKLAQILARYGKISSEHLDRYYVATINRGGSLDVEWADVVQEKKIAELSTRNWLNGKENPDWFHPNILRSMRQAGLIPRNAEKTILSRIERPKAILASPNYYLAAEECGLMSKDKVDQTLTARFWQIYSWALEDRKFSLRFRKQFDGQVDATLTLEHALVEQMTEKYGDADFK